MKREELESQDGTQNALSDQLDRIETNNVMEILGEDLQEIYGQVVSNCNDFRLDCFFKKVDEIQTDVVIK